MPYKVKGKCVYKKDTGKKVGCTKGPVKKYLAALHANVKDSAETKLGFSDFFLLEKDLDRQFDNELLLEKDHREKMIKFGIPKDLASYLHLFDDKYSIWFANQFKNMEGYKTAENKLNWVRTNHQNDMVTIKDWISNVPNIDIKKYNFDTALQASNEWHQSLGTRKLESQEKRKIIKRYDDGFYWVDLEGNRCKEEGEIMGHCATSGKGETLYSLRKYFPETNTIDGYITISVSPSLGHWHQAKGKKNSKPKPEYFKYIVDILNSNEIYKYNSEYDSSTDFDDEDYIKYIQQHKNLFKDPDNIISQIEKVSNADKLDKDLREIQDRFDPHLKHGGASYDVQEEDGYAYYYVSSNLEIELDDLEIDDELLYSDIDSDFVKTAERYGDKRIDTNNYYYKRNPTLYTKVSKFLNLINKNKNYKKYGDLSDLISGLNFTKEKKLYIYICFGEDCNGTSEDPNDYRYLLQTLEDLEDKYNDIKKLVIKSLVQSRLVKDSNLTTYTSIKGEAPFAKIKNFEFDEDTEEFSFTSKSIPNKAIDIKPIEDNVVKSFTTMLNNFIDENFKFEKVEDKQLKFKDMFESVTIPNFNGLSLYISFSYDHFNLNIDPENLDDKTIALIKFLDNSAGDIVNMMNLSIAFHNDVNTLSDEYVSKLRKLYGKFA